MEKRNQSPVRWLSDEAYRQASPPERALAWAASQVGVKEKGSNRGPAVEAYQQSVGLQGGGHPWCAAFVAWCIHQAQGRHPALPSSGAGAVRNWVKTARSQDLRRVEPRRGDLFYWLDPQGRGHIGWVTRRLPLGRFTTIEGNTDAESGSREGDGVYRRVRSVSALRRQAEWGFISWRSESTPL